MIKSAFRTDLLVKQSCSGGVWFVLFGTEMMFVNRTFDAELVSESLN